MGKWTDQGFVANSLLYYKSQLQELFIEAFGDDFLIDDSLPQGVLITRIAELLYNTDMDGIEAFSRLNINTATGILLDMIGNHRGLPRSEGTPQLATVTITSNSLQLPYTIPQGQVFTTTGKNDSFIAQTGKLITTATETIVLEYSQDGNSNTSVGDTMYTTNLPQITNLEVTLMTDGQPTEADIDYRTRLINTYAVANNTLSWVKNQLLDLDTVKTVGFNYNDTAGVVDTLPAYTTEWMVVPVEGADVDYFKDQVGTTIINNKVPSSPTAGNTTVEVIDVFGKTKDVNFTIPDKIELAIEVSVSTPETTGVLDLTNVNSEKIAISDYINSLDIGKNVSYARCLAPLTSDTGYDIVEFKIKDKAIGTWVINSNFTIASREYASIELGDITIGNA